MAFGDYRTAYAELADGVRRVIGDKNWKQHPLHNVRQCYQNFAKIVYEILAEDAAAGVGPDDSVVPGAAGARVESAMNEAEYLWYHLQRPYYRIYPDYARIFSRTSLDIPVRYLQVPYPVFALRFDGGVTFSGCPVTSVLAAVVSPGETARALYAMSEEQHQRTMRDGFSSMGYPAADVDHFMRRALEVRELMVFIQGPGLGAGVTGRVPVGPGGSMMNLGVRNTRAVVTALPHGDQIDTSLNHWLFEADDVELRCSSGDLEDLKTILRIVLSVSFLATGMDAVVEPEVLNRDLRAYLEAVNRRDTAAISRMAALATGVNARPGFVVGRPETLLGRRAGPCGEDDASGDGRELRFQHQRKGHLHRYWSKDDAGNRRLLMRFVRQLTVRHDLPLKPDESGRAGSHTLRTEAEMRPAGLPTT